MFNKLNLFKRHLNFSLSLKYLKTSNTDNCLYLNLTTRHSFTCPVPRTLKEIAKLPLLSKLPPERVKFVWNKQFEDRKDVVTTTLDSDNFELFTKNNKSFPMFITPIVYNSGFENLIWQFVDYKCALITSLETYKQKGRDSYPLLIFTAFDELLKSHQVSLLRIDVISSKISKSHATAVLRNIIKFYINDNDFSWVKKFNGIGEFDFESFKDNYLDIYSLPQR